MPYPEWPLISADSHGGPSPVLLEEISKRIPQDLRDEIKAASGPVIQGEGEMAREIDKQSGRRRRQRITTEVNIIDSENDPEKRFPALAADGVGAEALFGGGTPAKGLSLAAALADCQARNDAMAETYKKYYDRFAPAAAVPIYHDVQESVKELERAAKLGLRPVALPTHMDHKPWNRPDYEPLWAAANAGHMPIGIHVGGGRDPRPFSNPNGDIANYTWVLYTVMEPLTLFAGSGILDRYPNVHVHFVECDIGWLAWIMQSMDRAYVKHQHWMSYKLSMMPSEFVKRQISCSFPEDPVGIRNRDITGVDSLMWGSDFPHHEGSFPHSRDLIAETTADCTVEETKKITHDNAAKVFRLKADTFVQVKG